MAKVGEINYLRNLGERVMRHAGQKPFCDDDCPKYLTLLGTVMSLLPPPPARLLDLGCGPGWTSVFLAKRGYEVVGLDICPDMIAIAEQARLRERLDNLRFREADYETLPFKGEFDGAVFYDSLHHAVDEEQALRAAHRALRPGGVLVTSEPGEGHQDSPAAVEAVTRYGVTEKDMPPAKIIDLARRAGFGQFRVLPHVHDVNFLVELLFNGRERLPAGPRLQEAGLLKRLFHWVLRRRLGLDDRVYATLLAELPYFVYLCHNRPLLDHHLRHIRLSSGVVSMVKE